MDGSGANTAPVLCGVAETLLIPLAARAEASRSRLFPAFEDSVSELIAHKLGADLSCFTSDKASMRGSVVRAMWLDTTSAGGNASLLSVGNSDLYPRANVSPYLVARQPGRSSFGFRKGRG